jgi:archaellin
MKKNYVIALILLLGIQIQAQWTDNGSYLTTYDNVGIGLTNPERKLHIKSGVSNGIFDLYSLGIIEGTDARFQIVSSNAGSNGSSISLTNENISWTLHQKTASVGNRFDIGYRISSQAEDIASLQNIYLSILSNGNVLIGKTTQQNSDYKLDVAGSIRANEIKVNLDGADFVFEPDYKLRSLKELESYIQENKHLPEIPSADEMSTQGTELGELNTKLLQKIEELTLYMIDLNSKVEELEKENTFLKSKLNITQ